MNIIVLKNNLKDALGIISGVKKENAQLPILKNILVEIKDGVAYVCATDLDIGVRHKVSGKIIKEGSVAIPYTIVSQIVQNLMFERVSLETKGSALLIQADNYKARITTAPVDDFPIIPQVQGLVAIFSMGSEEFISALSRVSVACQVSDFRPELSGILLHYKNGSIRVVATDSFRLAKQEINAKKIKTNYEGEEFFCIIPLRTAQEVIRIFSNNKKEENLSIAIDENQIQFSNSTTTIVSRRITGKFPDYEAVIPAVFDAEITVKKEDIISALKLTSSLANRLFEVRFIVDESMKYIKLISSSSEFGESEYMLPIKATGQKLEVSFNWRFILDGIKGITTDMLYIGINNEQKPSVLKASNDSENVYVLTSIKSN